MDQENYQNEDENEDDNDDGNEDDNEDDLDHIANDDYYCDDFDNGGDYGDGQQATVWVGLEPLCRSSTKVTTIVWSAVVVVLAALALATGG